MKPFVILFLFFATFTNSFSQNENSEIEKNPGDLLWYQYVTGSAVRASNPVLTPEGNIIWVKYKWAGVPESDIRCFNKAGDLVWTKQFSERFEFDPMIIPQLGWIVIGSSTSYNKLFCLNQDGTERWNTEIPNELTQSPAMDSLYNIYIAAGTKLISYDSAGVFLWEYNSPFGEITTPLSVSKDGIIFFGSEFDKLVAVQNTGNEVFNNDLFGYTRGAPTIDFDGTIYMSTSDVDVNKSKIEVFNPDGSLAWEMTFDEPNPSAVIIGDSNYIYVRTMNFWGGGFGRLYKIDKTSQSILWSFYYGPNVSGGWDPSLSTDGSIYLTVSSFYSGNTGRYYAIGNDGNIIWEMDPFAATGIDLDMQSHMLIGSTGNIYAVAQHDYDTTYLLAIEDLTAILANSAWPMHKHDSQYSSLASNIVLPQSNIFINNMSIDFGYIEPGNLSNEQLTIYNIGTLPLELDWTLESEIFNLEIIGAKVINKVKSEIIQPGDSLLFNVTFSPVDTAMYSDTIIFTSNDPNQSNVGVFLKGKSTVEGEIKWKVQLSSSYLSGPALDDYGNIYVAGTYKVWKVQSSGNIKWEYEPESKDLKSDYTNITISNNNELLFMPWGKTILAIDSSGTEQWIFDPPTNDWVYPIAANNAGQLFFSESFMDGGGHLYCLDEQGSEVWNYYTGYNLLFPPSIEMNGNIISGGILGNQGKIFSVDNIGNWNWQQLFFPNSQTSIGFGNMIYIGGMWGSMGNYLPKVRSYNQEGSLNWEFNIENEYAEISSSIVTHPDGKLIFACSDIINENGTVYALDTEGNFLWERLYNGVIYSTPAIAENGLICFGCDDGNFYVLYPDGSERWNINTENEFNSSPVIDNNGIIYFTTESGYLYAVYGENNGLANTPWPMVQHDPKHTSSTDTLTVFIDKNDNRLVYTNKLSSIPNPFTNRTTFQWSSNGRKETKIVIFDLLGNKIFSQKVLSKDGINNFIWDGTNRFDSDIRSGIYICKLFTHNTIASVKLIKIH